MKEYPTMYRNIDNNFHPYKVIDTEGDDYICMQGPLYKIKKSELTSDYQDLLYFKYKTLLENGDRIPVKSHNGQRELVLEKLRIEHPELFI